jgi:dihydroorotase
MQQLHIIRPDDWHVHFRDKNMLTHTVNATARHFGRALVMPNLKPPLTTMAAIADYRQRILDVLSPELSFTPYLSLYLNETVTREDLIQLTSHSFVLGAKLYPAGATTNAELGVQTIHNLYPLFEVMQAHDLVLQIHGETTEGDIFSREAQFLERHLAPLIRSFPRLRIVLEHISSARAAAFVTDAPNTVAATITPHHLYYNRNALLAGGIKPHYYCLPILKTRRDQLALQRAAISGCGKFFAGTDSAPHPQTDKESPCGCAGIYSAPFAIAMYAELFDNLNQLNRLEAFTSQFGAEFYHLPQQSAEIILIKKAQIIPNLITFGDISIVPIGAGSQLTWSVHDKEA